MTWIITQVRIGPPYDHIAYHWVRLPKMFGEPDSHTYYRQAVSLNAFMMGRRGRNRSPLGHLFAVRWPDEWWGFSDHGRPVIAHADLWCFYAYIGYDYKNNKWV